MTHYFCDTPDGLDPVLRSAPNTWSACQGLAQQYLGATDEIAFPSAALQAGAASGWVVNDGLQPGPDRDGKVFVFFGLRPDLMGWATTIDGRPNGELLDLVSHF